MFFLLYYVKQNISSEKLTYSFFIATIPIEIFTIITGETMICFNSKSVSQTEEFAAKIAKHLKRGDVVAFFGSLGMGKTAFTRGLAKGLGNKSDVSSPTFAIVNDYSGDPPFVHFDMYKVESWEDLYSCGFFDYLDMGAILAVEWSENIENALPENTVRVTIEKGESENERTITIKGLDINEDFSS